MAKTRKTTQKKTTHLDSNNFKNLTTSQLREALQDANIQASSSFPLQVLRKLYQDNVLNKSDKSANTAQAAQSCPTLPISHDPGTEAVTTVHEECEPGSSGSQRLQHSSPSFLDSSTFNSAPIPATRRNTMSSSQDTSGALAQTMAGLQAMQAVASNLMASSANMMGWAKNIDNDQPSFILAQYYNSQSSPASHLRQNSSTFGPVAPPTHDVTGFSATPKKFGISAEDLPYMDLTPTSIRKKIIEGRDINLASLLVPLSDGDDSKYKSNLSIAEFITAFGRYKRIMCEAFPDRRPELDSYEAIIIDIYNLYGDVFYDYHSMFSRKSATALSLHKLKLDWSIRDRDLLQSVTAKTARIQSQRREHAQTWTPTGQGHATPRSAPVTTSAPNANGQVFDKHGRLRIKHRESEICNNYNSTEGCPIPRCSFYHICLRCKNYNHPILTCTYALNNTSKQASYPNK